MDCNNSHLVAPAIALFLETMFGLFNSVFIISVIFYDFHRQKTMSSSNKILLGLGISNVSYGLLVSSGFLDELTGPRASSVGDLSFMYIILLLSSISSCAWLTASLGAFYYVKIPQIRRLSWIKLHLHSVVPWMLLVVEVVSFIFGSCASLLLIPSQSGPRNITAARLSVLTILAENTSGFNIAAVAVTTIPFTILLFCTVCTIWRLKQHSQKMKRQMKPEDTGRPAPYERVVERMAHCLFFYIIFYTLMLILYFGILARLQARLWVTLLLLSAFTPVQSVLLILANPRLKDAWKEMMNYPAVTTRVLCSAA